jgi:hypothetical protein
MKKNIYILFVAAFWALLLASSCESELPTMLAYSSYDFARVDEDGGDWQTVLLDNADQIIIDVPDDVTSPEYQSELTDLKSLTASLTSDQRTAVDYWTNNPVIRWNEIALELVAKYNLIPGPNDDNTYTLPNPATPEGPSPFPFAHPPYAVRALAYLSVAQFDGLITAWHYKYQYDRPSPSAVDNTIAVAYTDNGIPSYPAEGAVTAIASRDILAAMFPLEKDYLAAKATEHLASLQWAGINVASDIEAGSYIGSEVAALALARAKGDGMSKAQCPKPVSDSIKASAFARFGWQWDNLEVPVRPVGLTPLYGKVQMWNVSKKYVPAFRLLQGRRSMKRMLQS